MKSCSKTATQTLEAMRRLATGGDVQIYRLPETEIYMPLYFERIAAHHGPVMTTELWALAHHYQQNGDLMRDPEVELLRTQSDGFPSGWYPVSYRQDGLTGLRVYADLDPETLMPKTYKPRAQHDLAGFMTLWTRNLRAERPEIANAHKGQAVSEARNGELFKAESPEIEREVR